MIEERVGKGGEELVEKPGGDFRSIGRLEKLRTA